MKEQNLKKLTSAELKIKTKQLLDEHFQLRMKKGIGQLAQTHLLKKNRRELARIKTIETEVGSKVNNKGQG